ncbi:MAG: hypothetical protein M1827_000721 [Pycnora praestabilis]|nr:MAG: hypothetical protein M1827_000721 [Pycnora praestabilis]
MATYNAYPPHHPHTTSPIPSSHALTLLQTYLATAQRDASRHPDALLTANGPISSNTSSAGGLTLHNLRRVEAGLRGEHLGADLSFGKGSSGSGAKEGVDGDMMEIDGSDKGTGDVNGHARTQEAQKPEEGWQSLEEYQREQEVEDGEIGQRSNVVDEGGMVPTVLQHQTSAEQEVGERGMVLDKEARKKAKKARGELRKREEQERRKREKEAEN